MGYILLQHEIRTLNFCKLVDYVDTTRLFSVAESLVHVATIHIKLQQHFNNS